MLKKRLAVMPEAALDAKAENEKSPSMTGFLFMILIRRAVNGEVGQFAKDTASA
ncbi:MULTISPECIES: hypothetical protein [Pseudomonas syringae group]|uniref:Uncharacterized protein n=1 Tax=Pseudomonas coronafaciens pv. coronafaciens TaxID=235275 RepID=A0AAE6UP32_9PSED|nr:hypothetical protein [Pseudomonas coronafaciens]KPB51594.1 Uncharacterized protein AC511_1752 [Pseudomonas coronafaciens pv. oryzae]QGT81793.1 hypothetical protein GMO17_11620 [Pseudomonas coronafaciens pv. coronafaciens]